MDRSTSPNKLDAFPDRQFAWQDASQASPEQQLAISTPAVIQHALDFLRGHELREYQDKTCVVVGGSRGIGLALSAILLGCGARVMVASRDTNRVTEAVDELKSQGFENVFGASVDARSKLDIQRAIRALDKHGLHYLFITASAAFQDNVHDWSTPHLKAMAHTNVLGVKNLIETFCEEFPLCEIVATSPAIRLDRNWCGGDAGVLWSWSKMGMSRIALAARANLVWPQFVTESAATVHGIGSLPMVKPYVTGYAAALCMLFRHKTGAYLDVDILERHGIYVDYKGSATDKMVNQVQWTKHTSESVNALTNELCVSSCRNDDPEVSSRMNYPEIVPIHLYPKVDDFTDTCVNILRCVKEHPDCCIKVVSAGNDVLSDICVSLLMICDCYYPNLKLDLSGIRPDMIVESGYFPDMGTKRLALDTTIANECENMDSAMLDGIDRSNICIEYVAVDL